MILPENEADRHALYRNLARECSVSQAERAARYIRLRTAYLTGVDQMATPPLYNGLKAYVRDATAQLYAPGAVRFGVKYPPHYGDEWHDELSALTVEAHRLWHETGMTLIYGQGVKWARVLGVSIFKNIVSDGDPTLELIPDPSDIGVWNELLPLKEQEAVCHYYDLPLARFERIAAAYGDAGRSWIAMARENARPPKSSASGLPPAMGQIILSGSGSVSSAQVRRRVTELPWTTAQAREPCIPMAELWVRDDHLQCYRRVGIPYTLSSEPILWEPPQGDQYDDQHAFHALTFDDVPGYLWGLSPMEDQITLNEWEMTRWGNADLFMQLQLDPPRFLRGIQGRDGEKMLRARRPGGEISSNDPTAAVESLAPPATILADLLSLIQGIRTLKDRQSGLPPGTRGEAQPGVRGGDQEAMLIGEASIQALWDAACVEATAGGIMTQILRMQRRRSGVTLYKANGEKFVPIQMPADFTAKVAAHSASPLYAARVRQMAEALKMNGAIDNETYVMLVDPPLADIIQVQARRRERAMAENAGKQRAMIERVADARVTHDLSKAKLDDAKAFSELTKP